MPLSDKAQKYADAIFATRIQQFSREYDHEAASLKAMLNRDAFERHIASMKVNFLLRQVRAKAEALQMAYEKDGKLS